MNGDRTTFLVGCRRSSVQAALRRGAIWSALDTAGIKGEKIAARGIELGATLLAGSVLTRRRHLA